MSVTIFVVLFVIAYFVIGAYVPFLGGVMAVSMLYLFIPVGMDMPMKVAFLFMAFVFGWVIAEIVRVVRTSKGGGSSGSGSSDSGGWFDSGSWSVGDGGGSCGDGGGGGGCE